MIKAMYRDIALRWIEALRSGRYVQGQGALTTRGVDGDRDCCLGVLCKIAVADGVISPGQLLENGSGMVAYVESTGILPYRVQRWAGLTEENPSIRLDPKSRLGAFLGLPISGDVRETNLVALNDSGVTFLTIANLIEAQYLSEGE